MTRLSVLEITVQGGNISRRGYCLSFELDSPAHEQYHMTFDEPDFCAPHPCILLTQASAPRHPISQIPALLMSILPADRS